MVGRRLRRGRRRLDILAVAAGDRVAVPVLPGAAAWGLDGAVPLGGAAAAAVAAAAVVSGGVPAGSGVLAVGGVSRRQRGGMAAAARCLLCFLGDFAVTRSCSVAAPWMCISSCSVQKSRLLSEQAFISYIHVALKNLTERGPFSCFPFCFPCSSSVSSFSRK